MVSIMQDYLKELDLNPPPAMGGPVNNPLDVRAMHYFGGLSNGQEIKVSPPTAAGFPRVLVSWQFASQPTVTSPTPLPAIDEIIDFTSGMPILRYDENHDRSHVIVWMDPAGPILPPGTPMIVKIRAWAK